MLRTLFCTLFLVVGCSTIERLNNVGKEPSLEEISLIQYDNTVNNEVDFRYYNSLWQPSSRYFFKDSRAGGVGDIIKINIKVSDNAKLENESTRSRKTTESLPTPKVFGIEEIISNVLPTSGKLLSVQGNNSNLGTGKIDRNEKISTQIAASVIRVLPNGNLVIRGTQEIRVNFEVRQIYIDGIVRPQDISSDNTVESSKVAELRVSYGGKGHLSDYQQPRLGTQLVDIISPF